MIRNLNVLMAAAMALGSIGAIGVAGAHAAEEKFHCSVEPCRFTARSDGTGKTAHQVFVVKGANNEEVSFTCNGVTAEATSSTKTATALSFTNINYGPETECSVNGTPGVSVTTTGCAYEFTSPGGATSTELHIVCTGSIRIGIFRCTFRIGSQRLKGPKYHNIGKEADTTTEVTVENAITGIAVTQEGTGCKTTEPLTGSFTTGNVIVTGETDPATGTPVMANGWWA